MQLIRIVPLLVAYIGGVAFGLFCLPVQTKVRTEYLPGEVVTQERVVADPSLQADLSNAIAQRDSLAKQVKDLQQEVLLYKNQRDEALATRNTETVVQQEPNAYYYPPRKRGLFGRIR